jgi:hypothetical protein
MVLHPHALGVSLGTWSALAGLRIGARRPSRLADAPIAWIGGAATDQDARVVYETLTRRRTTRYGAAVDDVAERLFRRDLADLGGAADIGFFQPLYAAYARTLLIHLDGTLVRIGGPR